MRRRLSLHSTDLLIFVVLNKGISSDDHLLKLDNVRVPQVVDQFQQKADNTLRFIFKRVEKLNSHNRKIVILQAVCCLIALEFIPIDNSFDGIAIVVSYSECFRRTG